MIRGGNWPGAVGFLGGPERTSSTYYCTKRMEKKYDNYTHAIIHTNSNVLYFVLMKNIPKTFLVRRYFSFT